MERRLKREKDDREKQREAKSKEAERPPSDKRPAHHEAERYPLTQQEIQAIITELPSPYDMLVRLLAARAQEAA